MKKDNFITQSKVLERPGWTKKAIRIFLGDPQKTATNPMYKSGPPLKMWDIATVEQKEKTKDFKDFVLKNEARRQGAKKAAQTKEKKIIEYVNKLEIVIPEIEKSVLIKRACDSYNDFKEYQDEIRGNFIPDGFKATPESDPAFLERICKNYIRHNLTDYENELEQIFGKTGKQKAYKILRDKVMKAIDEKYNFTFK